MLRKLSTVLTVYGHCSRLSPHAIRSQLEKCSVYTFSKALSSASDKETSIGITTGAAQKSYQHDADILYDQLRKAGSIPRILELSSQHVCVMNVKHIVAAFEVLHDNISQRGLLSGKSELVASLPENETFQQLCNHTLDRVRYMEPPDVITVFKTMSLLGVPTNTYIMQSLLKMMCSQVNQMRISELSFLNFLLSRHRSSPAVDGLKMALPLVLQVQIESQLDSDNVSEVVGCLKVCSQARLKPATVQKIVSALLKKKNVLTADQAVTVIFSLLNLDTPTDGYLELLNSAFHIAANHVEHLKTGQILHVARVCGRYNFFHPSFLVACAKKAVSETWNLEDCAELVRHLHKLFIVHEELLDLLCERILSNAETVRTGVKFSILHIATYFALTNYHSPKLKQVLEILCCSEEKLSHMYEAQPHFYARFVSCLAVSGYFPERILQHALNESFLTKAWSIGRKNGRSAEFEKSMCTLMWALEAHGKSESFQVPPAIKKQVVQSVVERQTQSCDYPLARFLENGLGGSQFFCTGIFSHSGHIIDHVLAMRSGNYPVALSSINEGISGLTPLQRVTYIEDLSIPNDAKIVAIILAREDSYCREPSLLKSWEKVKGESLSKKNYCPVLVNYPKWCQLPDREKIPYLMREIKEAVEAESLSRTNLP